MATSAQMAIDPTAIPKKMSSQQLEWWILFGICVAGKGAKQTERKLRGLLDDINRDFKYSLSPFDLIRWIKPYLMSYLRKHKIGQYKRINKAFRVAIKLDLDNLSIESLEAVPGIGPKTARMIIMYHDPTSVCAVLDTHILKWLKSLGHPVPKSTPSGKRYKDLERIFINEAIYRNKTVQELDTEIWKSYAKI